MQVTPFDTDIVLAPAKPAAVAAYLHSGHVHPTILYFLSRGCGYCLRAVDPEFNQLVARIALMQNEKEEQRRPVIAWLERTLGGANNLANVSGLDVIANQLNTPVPWITFIKPNDRTNAAEDLVVQSYQDSRDPDTVVQAFKKFIAS